MKGQQDRQHMRWFLRHLVFPWEIEALYGDKRISWLTMEELTVGCELLTGHPWKKA